MGFTRLRSKLFYLFEKERTEAVVRHRHIKNQEGTIRIPILYLWNSGHHLINMYGLYMM